VYCSNAVYVPRDDAHVFILRYLSWYINLSSNESVYAPRANANQLRAYRFELY
jgi:hypothetical protein